MTAGCGPGAGPAPGGRSGGMPHRHGNGCRVFPIDAKDATQIDIQVPLNQDTDVVSSNTGRPAAPASQMVSKTAALTIPDARFQFLYDAAVRTLLLLSADEVFPGPYTYRRFWFRDACLMMNALLGLGLDQRCERLIQGLPAARN